MFRFVVLFCLTAFVVATDHSKKMEDVVLFSIDNESYFEKTVYTESRDIITVPKQGVADRAIIVHDYVNELSAYKDLTARMCFVSPFYGDILNLKGVLFNFNEQNTSLPGKVFKMIAIRVIDDVERIAGQDIADMCQDLPTLWIVKESTENRSKRETAPSSAIVSVSRSTRGVGYTCSAWGVCTPFRRSPSRGGSRNRNRGSATTR